jgi:hypothetical protein
MEGAGESDRYTSPLPGCTPLIHVSIQVKAASRDYLKEK